MTDTTGWSRMSRQRYQSAVRRCAWALGLLSRRLQAYGALPQDPILMTRVLGIAFAVAEHETSWGLGWPPGSAMYSSLNLGGIQARKPPCGDHQVLHTDRLQDGTVYSVCFWRYDNWDQATDALIRQVYTIRPSVWQSAMEGLMLGSAYQLYRTKYYGGVRGVGNTEGNVSEYLLTTYPAILAATDTLWGGRPPAVWFADRQQSDIIFGQEDGNYVR